MNKRNIYITLAALLVAGCSCSSSDTETAEQKVALSLSAKSVVTKAADYTDLPNGLTTGVYVTDKGADITASYFPNWQYLAVDGGSLSSVKDRMILTVGRSYNIYAYSPYQANVTNPSAIPFTHGTDVLWAPVTSIDNVSETNKSASLAFQHIGSQVQFNVDFNPGFAGSSVFTTSSKIEVSGFYATGTLNTVTGVLSPAGAASVALSGVGTANASGTVTLGIGATNIIPGADMTLAVKVTHEGKVYSGTIKASPVAGNLTVYSVSVRASNLALGLTAQVESWVPATQESELE